eukprot:gnl/TRDRNA2_/TRDRNA2_73338_c0_seq1.p1 gnl/TRDRNA2_/TRDRNA2_73338_c0~~gnl/TRDRNA2_/TRDRNA2_73338_c0_seq1.p1  ORF type:complete len:334 (+),score=31.51 gnl/TRDRNA2_/TRDRNA2_73338_c0_seq1:45-1046(+)
MFDHIHVTRSYHNIPVPMTESSAPDSLPLSTPSVDVRRRFEVEDATPRRRGGTACMLCKPLDDIVLICIREGTGRNSLPDPLPDDALHEAIRLRVPVAACLLIALFETGLMLSMIPGAIHAVPHLCCIVLGMMSESWRRFVGFLPQWFVTVPVYFLNLLPRNLTRYLFRLKQSMWPHRCNRQSNQFLGDIIGEAFPRLVVGACGMIVAFCLMVVVWQRIQLIVLLHASQGPAMEAVVQHILRGPPVEVRDDDDRECAICLEADAGSDTRWRELFCGHQYHEECLLEWLRRARHCPLCRQSLHSAYLATSRASLRTISRRTAAAETRNIGGLYG